MKPLRDFDYDMLRKGLAGPFFPDGAEQQACFKLMLRGLMRDRQSVRVKPYRGRLVSSGRHTYETTEAGADALKAGC